MNGKLNSVVMPAGLVVMLAIGSAASADIISSLEVHYKFENQYNFGENSAGPNGVPCG